VSRDHDQDRGPRADPRLNRSRITRRHFLASSGGVAAGAVIADQVVGAVGAASASTTPQRSTADDVDDVLHATTSAPPRTQDLTVNGTVSPLGVDPDGCSFAWTLDAPGRNVAQTAYQIVVRRVDPGHAATVWDSGTVESTQQAFVPYGGPTLAADAAYTWTVRAKTAAGADSTTGSTATPDAAVWGPPSKPAPFVTGLRTADWNPAQWLKPAGASAQPDRVTYLRSDITPPAGTIRRATAYVSAAHTYRLYVNGDAADAWPSFSYPDEQYVRAVDLTRTLRPGAANAVGVLHRWYGPGQGRPASSPGLILAVSLWYADGRHVVHGTDGTWRETPAEWLPSPQRNSDGGDFVEWIDGRAYPEGWSSPGYDDSDWSPVTVIGPAGTAPFSDTYAQRTHIEEKTVLPVRLHTLANGSVVADFGAVYAARPRVDFASGVPGQTVAMRVGYLLDPDGQVSTLHGTQGTNLSFTYILRDGAQVFEAFTYLGFRYLQIDNAGQHIGRGQVAALARHTAMPAVPMATFSTGNRTLDAVWRLNARSCLYCSQEQFVDTPTREKGQFTWDASNESEGIMRCYGDQNLSWQGLRDVQRGQARYWPDGRTNAVYPNGDGARSFATFSARYVEWLWRYYTGTGDRTTALALYPSAAKVASWLLSAQQSGNGLLYGLGDTSNGDPVYGYDLTVAADTASNVLAVNAFTRVAQLATLANDPVAAQWNLNAARLALAINTTLRRPDGIYVDGVDASGAQSPHASQEANALALAYGVVAPSDVAKVVAYVAKLGISVEPNHGLELLRGLAAAGRPDLMVRTLTDATIPGWAHVLAAGGTFTWEVWRPSDLIGDSMSHGWGSSALVAMQETLLGLAHGDPGPGGTISLIVAPPTSGLPRASGSLPTPAGTATVSWQRRGSGITLALTLPANTSATVHLPSSDPSGVREGGVAAAKAAGVSVISTDNGMAVLMVGSGTYRFTTA
jgi:alpha-L-rhamnosidase